ncbi:hypothetical protein [Pseudomonas panipatensis]|uniref:Membrane-bound lysozyme-inhibitor of c-type lysozyme n=1 Tax=Pseudomonas panipatensis TaxID=428992 RepID=A0A1G8HLE7_9PSED|nr:hypothetical protein [Pseudomonas panipatensis]SDI07454.1 hypothetical protein SAMN05216272_105307 [Pseudomonas panipatensis]
MKALLAMTTAVLSFTALSVAAAPMQLLVPGSDAKDFGIQCQMDGKVTYLVRKDVGNRDYHVARNIYVTQLDGGRLAFSFLRGFVSADMYDTYFSATGESCNTFEQ